MALSLEGLRTSLSALQSNPPASQEAAATQWAQAYATYAQSAQSLDAIPAILPTTISVLQSNLLRSMRDQVFLPSLYTNIEAFWSKPPVLFSGPANSGQATFVGPFAGVAWSAGLAKYIAKNTSNQDAQYNPLGDLAALIHAVTLGVATSMTNLQSGVTTTSFLL